MGATHRSEHGHVLGTVYGESSDARTKCSAIEDAKMLLGGKGERGGVREGEGLGCGIGLDGSGEGRVEGELVVVVGDRGGRGAGRDGGELGRLGGRGRGGRGEGGGEGGDREAWRGSLEGAGDRGAQAPDTDSRIPNEHAGDIREGRQVYIWTLISMNMDRGECAPPLAEMLPRRGTSGTRPLSRTSTIFSTSSHRTPEWPRRSELVRTSIAARVHAAGIVVAWTGSDSGSMAGTRERGATRQ